MLLCELAVALHIGGWVPLVLQLDVCSQSERPQEVGRLSIDPSAYGKTPFYCSPSLETLQGHVAEQEFCGLQSAVLRGCNSHGLQSHATMCSWHSGLSTVCMICTEIGVIYLFVVNW